MADSLVDTRASILVVDDDDRLLSAVARLLRGHGFEVGTSRDADSAIRALEGRHFAAVVADQNMPGNSGMQLLVRIAKRWPHTARVLLSGSSEAEFISDALSSQVAHGFVAKPASAPELFAALDRALSRVGCPPVEPRPGRTHARPACVLVSPVAQPKPRPTAAAATGDHDAEICCLLVVGNRTFGQEILEAANGLHATTLIAEDAQSALQRVRSVPVDLCVIDVDTIGDGIHDIAIALKQQSPDTELILAASPGFAALAVAALRAGATDIVQRPVAGAELCDSVRRAVDRQRRKFTAALYGVTSAVFGAERDVLPELIVDSAARVMGADEASLLLPDGEGRLYVAHTTNPNAVAATGRTVQMSACIAGRIAATGQPAVLTGALDGEERFADLPHSSHPASSIVYPLITGETLTGVLTLNRGPTRPVFVQNDIERAGLLAGQVALALDNFRLVRTVAGAARLGAVGQLAAGMVHEINNPLACVLANLELARVELGDPALGPENRSLKPEAIQQSLLGAERGALRIMEIVRDVRLISRSDETAPSVFDLGDAVRSALRIAGAQLRRTAELQLELAPELAIEGNPGQISQVILHLVINAEEAMRSPQCERRQLSVRSWRDGANAMLQVGDTGPGIAENSLARIFQPFFTTKGSDGHVGLGLSMSREIVSRHGGTLHVASTLGRGATFTVIIPLAPPEAREA